MDWAEDLKATFKKTVKKGRRAAAENSTGNVSSDIPSTPDYDANFTDNPNSDEISSGLDLKSFPKSKKNSGWMDEPVRSASSSKFKSKPLQSELERFNTILATSPPSDDIPELPDLDDIIDESAFNEIKESQAVAANRVETYKELNSELLKYSEIASSENIDLSKLMKCLLDESVLADFDVPLTKEQLFNEVASIIRERQARSDKEGSIKSAD